MNIDINVLLNLNKQLQQKNTETEHLVAHVAHELLTPITSLMMTVDNLLDHFESSENLYTAEQIVEFLNIISRNGNDLKQQALHILDHFSGNANTSNEEIDIEKLIKETLEDVLRTYKKSNQDVEQLEIEIKSTLNKKIVNAPLRSVKTIIRNLLANAVKFTLANKNIIYKTIKIKVFENLNNVVIQIIDSGIGMSKQDSDKIFNFGVRSKNAVDNQIKGYGLGLTTVRNLIDSLGGSIVFNTKEQVGSSFTIAIPYDQEEEVEI